MTFQEGVLGELLVIIIFNVLSYCKYTWWEYI